MENPNPLLPELQRLGLLSKRKADWEQADEDSLLEFPCLSLEELRLITLGPFQLRVGKVYNEKHAPDGSGYTYAVHRRHNQFIKVKLSSRMKSGKTRDVYIKYVPHLNKVEGILGWYCLCANGARTLGCCGHVAAVRHFF